MARLKREKIGVTDAARELQAWHHQQLSRLITEIREVVIGEDMTMDAAKQSHSDAGAGYTIGVNSFKKEQRAALDHVTKKYAGGGDE